MYPTKTIIMNVIMTVHDVLTIDIDVVLPSHRRCFRKGNLVRNIINKQIIDNMTLTTPTAIQSEKLFNTPLKRKVCTFLYYEIFPVLGNKTAITLLKIDGFSFCFFPL